MKKNCLVILLAFVLLTQACKKNDVSSLTKQLDVKTSFMEKYMRVQNAKEGTVTISSTSYNFKNNVVYEVRASFADPVYQDITVDDIVLKPYKTLEGFSNNVYVVDDNTSQANLKKLFGKTVQVSLNSSGVSLRNSSSVYNPNEFNITGGARNTALSWNANGGGNDVYILIFFHPNKAINEDFSGYAPVSRYITTNDDGSHQLTEADFAGIPKGAGVDILIARGNTAVASGVTNGGGGTAIQAVSTAIISGTYGGSGGGGCTNCGTPDPIVYL